MPQRSLRPCKEAGCKELTRDSKGYCEVHGHIAEKEKAERNKYYDKSVRHSKDKLYTDFYHSNWWECAREDVLTTYNGIDVYAYYIENRTVIANTVHHIEELKDNWDKRLDIDNLFPLSTASHNKMDKLYKRDKKGIQALLRELLERYRKQFGISPLP